MKHTLTKKVELHNAMSMLINNDMECDSINYSDEYTSDSMSICSDISHTYPKYQTDTFKNLEYAEILDKIGNILANSKNVIPDPSIYSKNSDTFREQVQIASSIIENYILKDRSNYWPSYKMTTCYQSNLCKTTISISAFNISDKLVNDDYVSLTQIIRFCREYVNPLDIYDAQLILLPHISVGLLT